MYSKIAIVLSLLGCHVGISESGRIQETMRKRTLVVGAGVAGLTSARYLKEAGEQFSVLEATAYIGGTWRYEPRVGTDENGRPIYTSMYKYLRTNLPKPTMELPGFPMAPEMPSFPNSTDYYKYLESYADHFDLKKHIQFLREVISIKRMDNSWLVKYRDIITGEEYAEDYDFVMLCNGHHTKPRMPNFPGENIFKGTIIHSHNYREPELYENRRVLIVGAGPSGVDVAFHVGGHSAKLVHSHHSKILLRQQFSSNYVKKPDVRELTENGVRFKDGTFEEIDDIIYCTGFELYYPFLDESSGLTLEPASVTPLYRHIVNIHQPTMLVLGLVVRACVVTAIDAQARYSVALISGRFSLPLKDKMLEEWQHKADTLRAQGRPLSDVHLLANHEDQFYANLTEESGITRVPPVLVAIRNEVLRGILCNYYTFRNYAYAVVDDRHFTKELMRTDGAAGRLGGKMDEYYGNLTLEAGIARVPPVMMAIRDTNTEANKENFYTYRNYEYTVLNDTEFKRQYLTESTAPSV